MRTYVGDIHYEFDDAEVEQAVMKTISSSKLYRGMPLDASLLNDERSRLVNLLRDQGYYHLHKEFVSFRADTAADDYSVNLTLRVKNSQWHGFHARLSKIQDTQGEYI